MLSAGITGKHDASFLETELTLKSCIVNYEVLIAKNDTYEFIVSLLF